MYKIQLPDFEGPFDLLLYFIKRDEINIYDIPISRITEEFLNYITVMQYFDLELASEFILMASTLMYVKTQMLLPRQKDESGQDIGDPRNVLVQKILEYKQFKEASFEMAKLADNQKYNYYKSIFEAEYNQAEAGNIYKNATLFDLIKAFQSVIKRYNLPAEEHIVEVFNISIEDKITHLTEELKRTTRISFFDFVSQYNRPHIIVTFLAILEMLKLQLIFLQQEDNFSDIIIAYKPSLN